MSRTKVGSILKSKDGNGVYLKMSADVTLTKNEILNVQTKKEQLESLEKAVRENKLSPESAAKIKEYVDTIPDFVFAEVFKTIKK